MEIPEPPTSTFCTRCMNQITWEFSKLRMAWVSFTIDRDPDVLRVHKCRPTQHLPTWKLVRDPDPPTPEYRAAKQKIKERTEGDER